VTYRSRMGKGEETHPAEEFVVVREYALNQPESKRIAGVLELQELQTLSITQQTEVLEDNNHIMGGDGIKHLCRSVWRSYRFKLISEQHAAIFLYDPVDDEHDQLAQCRHRCGQHHSGPRFMQLEIQKEGLFYSIHQGREEGA
jgi:hypothetical protein